MVIAMKNVDLTKYYCKYFKAAVHFQGKFNMTYCII